MRYQQILYLGILPLFGTASPVPAEQSLNQWQQYADAVVQKGYPGVTASMHLPDGLQAVKSGYGNLASKTEIPDESYFRIGSVTKPFISVVILQLVAEKRLQLEDTVEKLVPGLLGSKYVDSNITVRHILQHTSGIPDYTSSLPFFTEQEFKQNCERTWTPKQLVQYGTSKSPLFSPGSDWKYSNTGYIIAGMIIDTITQGSWRTEVYNRIINPLNMTQTSTPDTATTLPQPHARGYDAFQDESGQQRPYADTTIQNPSWGGSAGEMISTGRDLNTFFIGLMNGKLLAKEQLDDMLKSVSTGIGQTSRYGLGLIYYPNSCGGEWGHTGGIFGFTTFSGISADGKRAATISVNAYQYRDTGRGISPFKFRTAVFCEK